jgi:hypothetical protein
VRPGWAERQVWAFPPWDGSLLWEEQSQCDSDSVPVWEHFATRCGARLSNPHQARISLSVVRYDLSSGARPG